MSLIVAARFTTFIEAENAAKALFDKDFQQADVSIFFVNPPGMHHARRGGGDEYADRSAKACHRWLIEGAGIGAALGIAVGIGLVAIFELQAVAAAIAGGVGAYTGSLIGALNGMRTTPLAHDPGATMDIRPSGVLLAVHVEPGTETIASDLLKNSGGKDVERADGRWQDGKWDDFDPVAPPVLSDRMTLNQA